MKPQRDGTSSLIEIKSQIKEALANWEALNNNCKNKSKSPELLDKNKKLLKKLKQLVDELS